jgi:hypothetical protein
MDAIKVRRVSAAGVVVLIGLILLAMMFPKLDPFQLPAASAAPQPTTGCGTSVHYTAYDAPAGSNQFGPTATSFTQTSAVKRLGVKLCEDPLFAATMVSFEQQGSNLNAASATALAKAYVANKSQWKSGVKSFNDQVDSYSVDFIGRTYETMRMVPGNTQSVMPALGKVARPVKLGYVLTLHLKDGQTRYLRIVCDLQPSAPNLPKVPVQVMPPVVPPTTHHPVPVAPTSPCHCTTKNHTRPSVQEPGQPGQVHGTAIPVTPAPTLSVAPGQPAPPPTSDGYNSGCTSGCTGNGTGNTGPTPGPTYTAPRPTPTETASEPNNL